MRPMLFSSVVLSFASFLSATAAAPAPAKPRAILDRIDYSYTNAAASFTGDSKTLATGGQPYSLKLWDVASGKMLRDLGQGVNPDAPSIYKLAFAPDGKTLAISTDDTYEVQLWTVGARKAKFTLQGGEGRFHAVLFSPDGKMLATACHDGAVRLYDPATGKLLRTLKGHKLWADPMAFSADGKTLACGSGGGDVHLWNVPKGTLKGLLPGHLTGYARNEHKQAVDSVALSADGTTVMVADRKGLVRVWDIAGGKGTVSFKGGAMAVLTADGKHVISNTPWEVLVHRTSDGECVAEHKYRYTHVEAFVLSPDGKTIASVLNDSRVLLWDVPSLLPKSK